MDAIEAFLVSLTRPKHTEKVRNPYRNKQCLNNLACYLRYMEKISSKRKSSLMLVGEAPGYRGCALTGIPFTSPQLIQNFDHPLFEKIVHKTQFPSMQETTAGTMWEILKDKQCTPLLWNAFPFHPHQLHDIESNRPPDVTELNQGSVFLQKLIDIFKPRIIAAIGRKGEKALGIIDIPSPPVYIRHPSYGGKKQFVEGMNSLFLAINH